MPLNQYEPIFGTYSTKEYWCPVKISANIKVKKLKKIAILKGLGTYLLKKFAYDFTKLIW